MVSGHAYLYKSGVLVCKFDGGLYFCFLLYVLCLMDYTKHEYFIAFCEYSFNGYI
jgi:hypothetical protein